MSSENARAWNLERKVGARTLLMNGQAEWDVMMRRVSGLYTF